MRTLLALLLAASPASALGPAPLPPLNALGLQGLRVAAGDAPGVGPGAVAGTRSSWQDLVRFSDGPNPERPGWATKPWTPAEKALVTKHLSWIVQNQPGLWSRCVAHGPLSLHRTTTAANAAQNAIAVFQTVTFQDRYFRPQSPSIPFDDALATLAHELVHVADTQMAISSHPRWRALVDPLIRSYRAQAPGLPDETSRERLALSLGLGSSYAADHNIVEALAEAASFVAIQPVLPPRIWNGLALHPDIVAFVRAEVLTAPTGPSLASELTAGRRLDAGKDPRGAYDAYSRAIAVEPGSPVAHIRRAELALKNPSLPRTEFPDLAAARPLLSDYDEMLPVFLLLAIPAEVKASRYGDALQDCARGAGVVDYAVLDFFCGRARMMDTLTRSVRRQIAPEERDRNYRQALEELRRAKSKEPALTKDVEPLERQLEGLLAPKPPAA